MIPGIYETLITHAIAKKLAETPSDTQYRDQKPLDSAEAVTILSNHIIKVFQLALKIQQDNKRSIQEQIEFCNDLISYIDTQVTIDTAEELKINEGSVLHAILSNIGKRDEQLKAEVERKLPQSGLTTSALFTGSNKEVSLDSEIAKDMLSADRIYLIVSFIRWSGLVIFAKILKEISQRPDVEIKIITTTYMGATEAKAIEFLSKLPNTKIKISYNTAHERLHAKSYIFERNTGFDTAYIGSSNMSKSALTKGLEWNMRVTKPENEHIIQKAKASFENYWNSSEFEAFEEGGIERFKEALAIENNKKVNKLDEHYYVQITPRPFQKEVLEKLEAERTVHGHYKNLIVAATGTGKTVISAFDFKRFLQKREGKARLLFIAHREEILKQARGIFRSALGHSYREFGKLWVGKQKPTTGDLDHLFVSVQTFNSQKEFFSSERIGYDYYDYIVIDETHHAAASTYQSLVNDFTPEILLGLTATPERMDGLNILDYFGGKIAAEIRLPDAMKLRLLSPFQYFCVSDESVDLRTVAWTQGKYNIAELTHSLSVQTRVNNILGAIDYYLTDPATCRALCFCASIEHAEYMAHALQEAGLNAAFLTSKNSDAHRQEYQSKLRDRKINFLCVVDLYNEGVDIPEIDTVLFLRPTESLTVYLQQLGRGLRIADEKECLTVLDFVNQANENYNFSEKFRALVGKTTTKIEDEITHNFPHLPAGCAITMDEQSQDYILSNIKKQIFNAKRLRREIAAFNTQVSDRELTIHNFTTHYNLDLRILYTNKYSWEILKTDAKAVETTISKTELSLLRSLKRIVHVDSVEYLNFIHDLALNDFDCTGVDKSLIYSLVFYYDIFKKTITKAGYDSIEQAILTLNECELFKSELRELIFALKKRVNHLIEPYTATNIPGLFIHAHYTRDELLALSGQHTPIKEQQWLEGVFNFNKHNCSMMMVTLNKSDKDFAAHIQYEDYAISENLFHWQSQNQTTPNSKNGKLYINHRERNWDMLLFVRDSKKDAFGITDTFWFLGKVDYQSHRGAQPMSIEWELEKALPPVLWESAAKMAVG